METRLSLGKKILKTVRNIFRFKFYLKNTVNAKDYLGWLSRTGRIEAVRHGKHGKWHASEESLKKYQLSLIPVISVSTPNEATRARSAPLLRTGWTRKLPESRITDIF